MSTSSPDSLLVRSAKDIVAGTIAGVGITLVGHPFDTLKVRLQTQSQVNPVYSGLGDCISKTWKSEGFSGFYRGVSSPLAGQMFFNAVQFLAYGQAKDLVKSPSGMTIANYFQAGALTGGIIAFIEGPIDLFKTQLQTQIFQKEPKFTNFIQSVKYITSNFGIAGAFQGVGATVLRNVPAVSAYFGAYEYARLSLCTPGQSVETLSTQKLLTAGAIGGFAYWIFTYPVDVIKSAMMADSPVRAERRFASIGDCARKLYAEGGIKRFYVGLSPCLLRAAPANATCFFLYQKSVEWLGKI